MSSYLKKSNVKSVGAEDWQSIEEQLISSFGEDPEFKGTLERVHSGSPLSKAVAMELIARGSHWELQESFEREWDLAINFSKHSEFTEGVRSVLIDKDNSPKWKYVSYEELDYDTVDDLFHPSENNLLAKEFSRMP